MNDTSAKHDDEIVCNPDAKNARVVQLKSGRPGPCLLLVPGLGGRIEPLANLGTILETPMPVFAIEARGVRGWSPPDIQVEETAQRYLGQLKTLQASGPYYLIGHSFGGLVTFEMARCLVEADEKIACLILLDAGISKNHWPSSYYLKDLAVRLYRYVIKLGTASSEEIKGYLSNSFRRLVLKFHDPYDLKSKKINTMIADKIAFDNYHPTFFSGKIIFFRAMNKDEPNDPDVLWRSRVGELEIRAAKGGHNSMLDPLNVSSLAVDISTCLTNASTG